MYLCLQVIFTLKCNAEIPTVSWSVATIPADIVMIASYTYLAMVCYRSMYGRYHLKPAQICSLAGYLVSLTLLAAAVAITVYKEHLHGIMWNYGVSNTSDLPSTIGTLQYILCTLAVSVSTLCIIVILNMEGRALAHSRGFRNPIPLSLYKDGWMPTSGCGDVYTILLGTIEVRAASPAHIGAHIANASRLLATRSSSGHRYGGNGEHNSGHISPIDAIAAQAQRGAGAGAGLGTSNPTATVRGSGFKKGSSHQKKNSSRGDGSWEHRQLLQEWEGEIELLVRKASPLHDHSAV